jgi:hypothetical protein
MGDFSKDFGGKTEKGGAILNGLSGVFSGRWNMEISCWKDLRAGRAMEREEGRFCVFLRLKIRHERATGRGCRGWYT